MSHPPTERVQQPRADLKQCPRCLNWFRADYYVEHAWYEKP